MYFRASRRAQHEVSLSETGDDDSLRLLDMISVEDEGLHLVEMSDSYQKMYRCLITCLEPREREIICLRYGLTGAEPQTQRDVAAAKGISRSYVSRIEKKALGKMRAAFEG